MILLARKLLMENEDIRTRYQERYIHVMVGKNDKPEEKRSKYIYVIQCVEKLDGKGVAPVCYMAEYMFDTPEEAMAFMDSRLPDLEKQNYKIKLQWEDESDKCPPVYLVTYSMTCKKYDRKKYEDRVEFAKNLLR